MADAVQKLTFGPFVVDFTCCSLEAMDYMLADAKRHVQCCSNI